MKIQLNTDANVDGRTELAAHVSTLIEDRLSRFASQLTRVEVHLGDESAGRTTESDKRCIIEARPERRAPLVVTNHAATINDAFSGALDKLATVLDRDFGRQEHRRGTASIRTWDAAADAAEAASPRSEPEGDSGETR
ncbi:MAG: HPF/RaiA family ribosome-associated protein [Mycobacteriales bacterium]